jgi:large subunit ribosomal protein L19
MSVSRQSLIDLVEKDQIRTDLPKFSVGDSIIVDYKIKEGSRSRVQSFDGVVIAIRNRGINSAFTVRHTMSDESVERVFQSHSPLISGIKVKRRGDVRQAKLYYLRDLSGRAARIKEKL